MQFVRRVLDAATSQIFGTLVVGLLTGVGLSIWGLALNWGPLAVLFVVAVPTILLWMTNQVQEFFEHHPRKLSTSELLKELTTWLVNGGYTVRKDTEDTTEFMLVATFENGDIQPIVIRRLKDDSMPLLLSASMSMGAAVSSQVGALDQSAQKRLMFDLRIEIMRFGLNYQGFGTDSTTVTLSKSFPLKVSYGTRIMSQKAFIEEVQILRRASHIVRLMITRSVT